MPTSITSADASPHTVSMRQCPFCGKNVPWNFDHCSYCREALPLMAKPPRASSAGDGGNIRRGLLYMLLGAVIHYFAGGYSAMNLPFPIVSVVTSYLSPVVFLGGFGLALYGFYRKHIA